MKRLLFLFILVICLFITGQEKLTLHLANKSSSGMPVAKIDSVIFNKTSESVTFMLNDSVYNLGINQIDSISFQEIGNIIKISYNENETRVVNPYAFEGLKISINGNDVTVVSESETKDLIYELSGNCGNGSFNLSSQKSCILRLNGLTLGNNDGPAINILSGKAVTVILPEGMVNNISDGYSYEDATLKAALFSEGQLIFNGGGTLNVTGKGVDKHGICSDDYIQFDNGNINVLAAIKDGIHGKDGVFVNGGTLKITSAGDGIDCEDGPFIMKTGNVDITNSGIDVSGIKTDSTLTMTGGKINVSLTGNNSKALKSKKLMQLSGGEIVLTTSGGVVLEPGTVSGRYDPSYCTAVRSDGIIKLNGSDLKIISTGVAGKGISSETGITISGGNTDISTSGNGAKYTNNEGAIDSYNSTGLSSDGFIELLSGNIKINCSGSASKGISSDGNINIGSSSGSPVLNVTTTGAKINLYTSGREVVYAESKAIKSDGAITFDNGTANISSADDGLKSDVSITINNGILNITKSVEGIEAPVITVNNGTVNITASDDSFNATKGSGGEGNDGSYLYLKGGNIFANSTNGDGLDSNGNIVISGGKIVVHGPQSQPEVGMDYNGTCSVTGGFLVISGTNSNMTQAPGTASTQYSVKATTSGAIPAGTLFHIQDATGSNLLTFKPLRSFYSIVFSSPDLKAGTNYSIYTGGVSTGENTNGLFSGGIYSGGTLKKTFTITSRVTSLTF